ncbi:hypothetical protein K439DRAFT_1616945 [Ramaria rubella]|nr:hypothetical protein K439DRAFT_1616945 [Ramaria rubella]
MSVAHGKWIKTNVQPAYHALFKDCDDTPVGTTAHCKIVKDSIKRKSDLDNSMHKTYAESGKKYRVIQRVAAKMEEQAQYAHNVCGVEVFGIVYESTYGDIDAMAANTIFTGSSDIADKKVARKALISEIQGLIGVKIRQDMATKKNKKTNDPSSWDEWRHAVKDHFHELFFPDDDTNTKHVLWTSRLPLPNQDFDLNKLQVDELKLLLKADVDLEDWTEEEKESLVADQVKIVIISSGSGRTLMSLDDVSQWHERNMKRNKHSAPKTRSPVPSSVLTGDGGFNAPLDTNDCFQSPGMSQSPLTQHVLSPTIAPISMTRKCSSISNEDSQQSRKKRQRVNGSESAHKSPHMLTLPLSNTPAANIVAAEVNREM